MGMTAAEADLDHRFLPKNSTIKFTVIVLSYNYERFVGAAIDSALAIDWPDLEVIVVDDGSTDGSRAIIESYGSRITALFQENSSQVVGYHNGYAHCSGDLVLFLDSDDLLDPSIARETVAALRPGVTKVQFQMRVIDGEGAWLGTYLPQYPKTPSSAELRICSLRTAYYQSPPGSGNVYTRDYLRKVMPFYPRMRDNAGDTALVSAAPYLGDVVVIAKPLVCYRIHGRNQGALITLDNERFGREVQRFLLRQDYAGDIAIRAGLHPWPNAMFNSLHFNPYRLASLRLAPDLHPIKTDSRLRVLWHTVRGAFIPQGMSAAGTLAIIVWTILTALAPSRMARTLILWRFAPTSRPQGLRTFMRRIGIMR